MMRKIALLLWVLLVSIGAGAQTTEINFKNGSMADILAQAKKENKPVFMDAYAVWCGPCKWMDKNVFTDPKVAAYFNANFVNYKVDMEKGEGIELAQKYGVRAYPSYLFLNADGTVMHRSVGSRPADMFMAVAATATDPTKNMAFYQNKYNSGDRSSAFMLTYLNMLDEAAMDAAKEADEYLATQKPEDLVSRGNWNIIMRHVNNLDSPAFRYLVKNRDAYAKKYSADSVEMKISYLYGQNLMRAAAQTDEPKLKALKSEIAQMKLKDGERYMLMADATYYGNKKDMKNYHLANTKLADTYYADNSQMLNSLAWKYYETVDDKAMLEKAAQWSSKSVSMNPVYAYLDTNAALLYKLGKKEEAKKMATKAIETGKANGEDVTSTEELLTKINQLK